MSTVTEAVDLAERLTMSLGDLGMWDRFDNMVPANKKRPTRYTAARTKATILRRARQQIPIPQEYV